MDRELTERVIIVIVIDLSTCARGWRMCLTRWGLVSNSRVPFYYDKQCSFVLCCRLHMAWLGSHSFPLSVGGWIVASARPRTAMLHVRGIPGCLQCAARIWNLVFSRQTKAVTTHSREKLSRAFDSSGRRLGASWAGPCRAWPFGLAYNAEQRIHEPFVRLPIGFLPLLLGLYDRV